jgi:hypothetical protein
MIGDAEIIAPEESRHSYCTTGQPDRPFPVSAISPDYSVPERTGNRASALANAIKTIRQHALFAQHFFIGQIMLLRRLLRAYAGTTFTGP